MCDFLSGWISIDERTKPEMVCDVPYTAHNEMARVVGLARAVGIDMRPYREFEWTGEDVESLDVRTAIVESYRPRGEWPWHYEEENPDWLKARIIDKYPVRQKLLESLGERIHKTPTGVEWRYWQGKLEDNGKPAISWPNGVGISCRGGEAVAYCDECGRWHALMRNWGGVGSPQYDGNATEVWLWLESGDRIGISPRGIVAIEKEERVMIEQQVPRSQVYPYVVTTQPIKPMRFLSSTPPIVTVDDWANIEAKDGKSVEIKAAAEQRMVDIMTEHT